MNNVVSLLKLSETIDEKLKENEIGDLIVKKKQMDSHCSDSQISPYVIRYLLIVIDCSKSMKTNDYKPNRFQSVLSSLRVLCINNDFRLSFRDSLIRIHFLI